jgi:hypothetical protein
MAIAFKKPFGPETQAQRDSIDMSDKQVEEIPCGDCESVYVLIFPRTSTEEQRNAFIQAVRQAMGNCQHHPPFVNLTF